MGRVNAVQNMLTAAFSIDPQTVTTQLLSSSCAKQLLGPGNSSLSTLSLTESL